MSFKYFPILVSLLLTISMLLPGEGLADSRTDAMPADPTLFVENVGQFDPAARFQVWGSPLGTGTTWLAEDAIWMVVAADNETTTLQSDNTATFNLPPALSPLPSLSRSSQTVLKLSFPGSNPNVRVEPFDRLDTNVSYFIGNDPDQWRPDVPVWGGVRYVDIYPGVDLALNGGHIPGWWFEAAPGAPVEQIRVQVEGADIIASSGGVLHLAGDDEMLSLLLPSAPFAYRAAGRSRQGGSLALTIEPSLGQTQPVQPVDHPEQLLYSTFLGGSGLADSGRALAVDALGSVYVAGETGSSDFPVTPGTFDPGFNGGFYDAFVAKLNPAGSELVYATFLGGSGFYEAASGITVDGTGNAYVTGGTDSPDFPTTPGAFDPTFNGGPNDAFDAFVVKLDAAGSALVYASFLGGGNGGEQGNDIEVDALNNAYIVGETWSSDFPITPGALDASKSGPFDTFVVKLNAAGSELSYATFLGGSNGDQGWDISVDTAGSAYVAGNTSSSDFPTTPGAFDPSFNGGPFGAGDAFVVKLNLTGTALDYATFLGGSGGDDGGSSIDVDALGSAYVIGQTSSSDFPVTQAAFDSTHNGALDLFVAKLDPTGSSLTYATFLGTTGLESGGGIAVDATSNVYLSGTTNSSDFPTTQDALDSSYNDGGDIFIAKLNPAGSELVYSSFLGGSGSEGGDIIVDAVGNVYASGNTDSSDFPTTSGAFDQSYNGGSLHPRDAFIVKLRLVPLPTDFLWLPLVGKGD